jgi:UDP-N-acetylglucosamine 2-epimerase (hydrolysing)
MADSSLAPLQSGFENKTRRIVFVTGTRADFGKLEPLEAAVTKAGFETVYFVTGMHMKRRYGDTRLEVRRKASCETYEYVNQSDGDHQDQILMNTMRGFGDWINEYPADLVVIHGDRVEALAVAMTCAMRYIKCAHIEGGEVSGTIDEVYRHCNSKLCRYHFVSSEIAAARVQSLGEHPSDTFVIGSPELDIHKQPSGVELATVLDRYDITFKSYGIVIFHPVTSELSTIEEQVQKLFETLVSSNKHFVVICPNNDPGSDKIFSVLDALPPDRFRVIPSMRFAYFSELMKNAQVIVGNSSLGVREAPFLGVPSIDIGTRQTNRSAAPSIINADARDHEAICEALDVHWGNRYPASKEFGQGNAGEAFLEIITSADFWDRGQQKTFFDKDE